MTSEPVNLPSVADDWYCPICHEWIPPQRVKRIEGVTVRNHIYRAWDANARRTVEYRHSLSSVQFDAKTPERPARLLARREEVRADRGGAA